jgi:hypothetical protein
MSRVVDEVGRFVIGDRGYRQLYGQRTETAAPGSPDGRGARTLVRETNGGLRVCVYYPDALITCLELHPPQRGLDVENVDAFSTLVEELDHLLCIAERAHERRAIRLFELELHANVSKYLVLIRFLVGSKNKAEPRQRAWLRYHLFHKRDWREEDSQVRDRYRDAAQWAVRLIDAVEKLEAADRIDTLRSFHRAGTSDKLEMIRRLAA